LPGISLRELTNGDGIDDSFSSLDGSFTFSNFRGVEVSDSALRNLDLYRVFRLEDGFKLLAPMGAFFGSHGQLELSYDVTANGQDGPNGQDGQDFLIEAMSMSILGIAVGSGSVVEATAWLPSGRNLHVEAGGLCGHGEAHDAVQLAKPLETLSVHEAIAVASGQGDGCHCFGGFALGTLVAHRFNLGPLSVPEPATALMLGGGLVSLVAIGQRRRRSRGLRR
jgi:hypothetical protein